LIDEVAGNVLAENITILPDSNVYKTLAESNQEPVSLISIRVPKLEIRGVRTPKILMNKEISAHFIKITDAVVAIRTGKAKKGEKINFKKELATDVYHQILGNLKSISADSIVLENISVTVSDNRYQTLRYKAVGLSIRLIDLAIDSTDRIDSGKILFSRDISLQCDSLYLLLQNRYYNLFVKGFDYESDRASLHIDQLKLSPKLTETAFAGAFKFAKDRFDISVKMLDILNIDRQRFIHQQLVADEMKIRQSSVFIFRDKSVPHDSIDRTDDYPQLAIMKLPLAINFRKIAISDTYIEYKEKNEKSDSSGKVAFFKVVAQLSNVTNIEESILSNNRMILDFKSSFLRVAPFHTKMVMLLNDRQGRFYLNAELGAFGAEALNPLLKPMALAEIKKGQIKYLEFHLNATNLKSSGTLKFCYDDLNLNLLKKDEDENKYKNKILPSLLASMVIRKSNPSNGHFKTVSINYKRDIHRSIFNLMWKSLFTGIKETAM
jgi:hypothetical protein